MASSLGKSTDNEIKKQEPSEDVYAELSTLRRKVKRLEKDLRFLALTNEKVEGLYKTFEEEKKFHYLQKDLLLKNAPNMVLMFDKKLNLTLCSEQCAPILDFTTPKEMHGLSLHSIFQSKFSEAWIKKIVTQCKVTMQNSEIRTFNDELYINDAYFYGQTMISPIITDENECLGAILSITDSTELALTKKQVEIAAQAKTAFLASMSHEIRTPLNAIKGLSELLLATKTTPVQENYLHNIVKSSQSLLHIINDILDFSKVDAGKMEIIHVPFKLSALVSEVLSTIMNVMVNAKKKIILLTDIDPALPNQLKGDDARVKQVLLNLLSNAIKYTKEGFIKLTLTQKERTSSSLTINFIIEDTGSGIKSEHLSKIFDAFSRVNLEANKYISGTGLGLAISKKFANAMNGDITAESIFGSGSIFTFTIPFSILNSAPLASEKVSDDTKVLLFDSGIHAEYSAKMLTALNVKYTCVSSNEEIESLELSTYTHCMNFPYFTNNLFKKIRKKLKHCKVMTGIDIHSPQFKQNKTDMVSFEPLLITDVIKFLGGEVTPPNIPQKNLANYAFSDTHVLVVDDNDINLLVAGELLKSYGLQVSLAESGSKAISMCIEKSYNLIFMDHMMPVMDGIEATRRIQNFGRNQGTPIIALTANVIIGMKEKYLESGMVDCLSKPIKKEDLEEILIKWISPKNTIITKV